MKLVVVAGTPGSGKTSVLMHTIRSLKQVGMSPAVVKIDDNDQIETIITEAFKTAAGNQPVIVDVRIDYSKRTRFTQGVVKTVLKRFPLGDKMRFIGRAMLRKVTG
ncbi:MAG: hypothetical protein JRC99_06130 [Deltaproteobacteria bacterium]|nr:hypothetical protein [Deltaproteobacteria bacterium]